MSHPGQAYEPKTMKHPHTRKGKITPIEGIDPVSGRKFTDSQGEPDVFPDVTVKDPTTESYYRAMGYLVPGEVPPPPAEYSEYPVMLVHPQHTDATPDDYAIEKAENGEILRHRIPGKPETFPSKVAHSPAEEEELGKTGYKRAGQDNPDAIRTAKASPYVAGQTHAEFPKLVNGEIVDPNAPETGPKQYPKWVGDKLVNSRAEEMALLSPLGAKLEASHIPGSKPPGLLKMTAREARKDAADAKRIAKAAAKIQEAPQPASEGAERQTAPAGE